MPEETRIEKLTVEEKICLHLLDYTNLKNEFILPESISQSGIAKKVGVQRGHASVGLISLKKKGLVEERVSRVHGSSRRKKVYFLTEHGLDDTLKIRKLLEKTPLLVRLMDEERTIHLKDINRYLKREISLIQLLTELSNSEGPLDIESLVQPLKRKADERSDEECPQLPVYGIKRKIEKEIEEEKEKEEESLTFPPPSPSPLPSTFTLDFQKQKGKLTVKNLSTIGGVILSFISLFLLSSYLSHENVHILLFALICLVFSIPLMLVFSFPQPSDSGIFQPQKRDIMILGFSIIVLWLFAQALLEEEFAGGEILRAVMVMVPFLLLVNLKGVVTGRSNLDISGIGGSLCILYGLVQTAFSLFTEHMHYPFLWVVTGLVIIINGYLSSARMEKEESGGIRGKVEGMEIEEDRMKSKAGEKSESILLISFCTGAGIFILISLLAIYNNLSHDFFTLLLIFLWTLFALSFCSLRSWQRIEHEIKPLLISSMLLMIGSLFFFAAGVFFSLEKFIEGVVEIMVGLIILRFNLQYLKWSKEYAIFNALFVVIGVLTVYDYYMDI